jgi:hypothetical protein
MIVTTNSSIRENSIKVQIRCPNCLARLCDARTPKSKSISIIFSEDPFDGNIFIKCYKFGKQVVLSIK